MLQAHRTCASCATGVHYERNDEWRRKSVALADCKPDDLLPKALRNAGKMTTFVDYVHELKSRRLPLIEPQVQKLSAAKQRELREQRELEAGAVRSAVLVEASGPRAVPGDVVYFDFTSHADDGSAVGLPLASSEPERGGSGGPCIAALEDKHLRIPRAWELVMQDMCEGQRSLVVATGAYGWDSVPEEEVAAVPRPPSLKAGTSTRTEIQLLKLLSGSQAKPLATQPDIVKFTARSGADWQTPRPPFEVSFSAHACPVTLFADPLDDTLPWEPCRATLGSGTLPAALEACLSSMAAREAARFAVPVGLMACAAEGEGATSGVASSAVAEARAARHDRLHICVRLGSFTEVRDMTGDGRVVKRKITEGRGSFPIDAPIQDAVVRIHYSIHRPNAAGRAGALLYDSAAPAGAREGAQERRDGTADDAAAGGGGGAVEVATGEGIMPEGVEMALKLMLPGERAEVHVRAREFGYASCAESPPAGVLEDEPLVFCVDMVGFEKAGHPQTMSAAQVIAFALRQKEVANELYKKQRPAFALRKYRRALAVAQSCRGADSQEEYEELEAIKAALLANCAAVLLSDGEYAEAIRQCDASLAIDPANAKVQLRKARACSLLGQFDEAEFICQGLLQLEDEAASQDAGALLDVNARRRKTAMRKQNAELKSWADR